MNHKSLFKKMAIRSLRRSIKANGITKTRQWASTWNPESKAFLEVWEEAKKEVLK